jgi:hypothetical protein
MRSPAVENFLFDQPEPRRQAMEALRAIIFATVAGVEEAFKWKVPFYSKNGLLCYINYDRKYKKIALGLVEGFLIEDRYHLFVHDTSNVKKLLFEEDGEFPLRKIQYYLREAVKINRTKQKNFVGIKKKPMLRAHPRRTR